MDLSARLAASILDSSVDLLLLVDATGTIRWTSRSVTDLLGYERRALVGAAGLELVHPDDRDLFAAALVVSIGDPGPYAEEQGRFLAADGSWVDLRAALSASVDHDDERLLVIRLRAVDFELQLNDAVHLVAADKPWRDAAQAVLSAGIAGRDAWNAVWVPSAAGAAGAWLLPTDREHLRPALEHLAAHAPETERLWTAEASHDERFSGWLDASTLPPALGEFCRSIDCATFGAHPVVTADGRTSAVLVNFYDRAYGPENVPVLRRHRELQISILRLAIEQEHHLEALRRAALTDPLTGLANRAGLWDVIGGLERGVVAYLDLDGFKAVNDTLGHQAGDQVLIEVARRLRATCRHTEVAARVGGDEFVLVGDIDDATAETMLGRLTEALAAPIDLDGRPAAIRASIGMSRIAGAGDAEAAIVRADARMLANKSRNGRRSDDRRSDLDRA